MSTTDSNSLPEMRPEIVRTPECGVPGCDERDHDPIPNPYEPHHISHETVTGASVGVSIFYTRAAGYTANIDVSVEGDFTAAQLRAGTDLYSDYLDLLRSTAQRLDVLNAADAEPMSAGAFDAWVTARWARQARVAANALRKGTSQSIDGLAEMLDNLAAIAERKPGRGQH